MQTFTTQLKKNVIKVSGEGSADFLQGLISQDINLLKSQDVIYSLLLTPNGRIEFEFFICKANAQGSEFYIIINKEAAEDFINKVKIYKLRRNLLIELTPLQVIYTTDSNFKTNNILSFKDSRLPNLGSFILLEDTSEVANNYEDYKEFRFLNALVDQDEIIRVKSIPLEFGYDELNAISYTKGCYMGQEFTNSTKRGVLKISKRVIPFVVTSSVDLDDKLVCNNEEIGKVIGINKNTILALVKMKFLEAEIQINNQKITPKKPNWIKTYTLD